MSKIFTDKQIKNEKPKGYIYDLREPNGNGFALRVFPSGEKSWVFIYTFQGRKRRMTLGKYPTMTLKKAKSEHRKALDMLQNDKKDPAFEKQKEKAETRDSSTIEGLIEEYIKIHAEPNKRSWKEDQRMLNKDVRPAWGKRKAKDITRHDVIQLLDKIKVRGSPIIANRTFACMRRMFNFAIKRAILDASPCIMIEAPAKENRRDRYLSTEEIKIFWYGLDNAPMSQAIKLALKFLLVTAQRKSEVISAEWSEIDFTTNIWTIPADKAKNKSAHRVPLSKLALELLAEIKKINGDSRWLFPSERINAPIRGQSVDHALRRSSHVFPNVKSFCVHDCRRTAATHMAGLRISGETLSRILNHAKKGVTEQHYIKHGYDDEKRHALDAWARKLKEITTNNQFSNVISLTA